jgi:hypothetical protein
VNATASSPASQAPVLPPPAPGFAGLVRIHLAVLLREFPVAWILFAVVILWLPIASILVPAPDPAQLTPEGDPVFQLDLLVSLWVLNSAAAMFAVLVALLWPDAVWRNLPPGGREAIDALPPSRRLHRSARFVAGAFLPLAMFASIAATTLVLRHRAASGVFIGTNLEERLPALTLLVGVGGLIAAYALGSALALRFGRVLLPLIIGVASAWAVVYTTHVMGWTTLRDVVQEGVFRGPWSPTQAFFALIDGSSTGPAAVTLWLVVLVGLTVFCAGLHDRS